MHHVHNKLINKKPGNRDKKNVAPSFFVPVIVGALGMIKKRTDKDTNKIPGCSSHCEILKKKCSLRREFNPCDRKILPKKKKVETT